MKKNLMKTYGLTSSQRVLLALVEKGCMREEAYKWVQQAAFKAWEEGQDFREVIQENPKVIEYIKPEEIQNLFDWNYHLKHIDDVFKRLGLI
jgi:adenylosuccinate lyase